MTTAKPNPAPQSEEELLEQWAFLDRLVEKQAAQLRAGIQDAEELDDPVTSAAEVEGLRRDVERLRAELGAAQSAREAAEAEAERSRDALVALTAAHQEHLRDAERMRERHHALERAAAGWRDRAEVARRELAGRDQHERAELDDLNRRLTEADAGRHRAELEQAEALEALSQARLEVERLHTQMAAVQHSFWRFGRH
ncbi:MAG: hypothetical protein ACLQGJ_07670 [Candidatus Dormibacteria bacterium]